VNALPELLLEGSVTQEITNRVIAHGKRPRNKASPVPVMAEPSLLKNKCCASDPCTNQKHGVVALPQTWLPTSVYV
jgi:hypothetical protein